MDLGSLIAGLVTGLREGVEAALIVSIILAYLAKTGNRRHFTKIWIGAAVAIALSLAVGIGIFVTVGEFEAPYEQLFEASTMVLATAVLTWMLFWMRRQARSVRGELQAAVDRVLTEGNAWSLAVLAFSAVIREGVETSLFMVGQVNAAAANGPGAELAVLLGALIGLAIAIAIGWIIYTGSRRINYATFFRLTGLALVFIAAGLLSHAVHELIEVGWITVLTGTVFDISAMLPDDAGIGLFLRALFGYSAAPEVLTVIVYLAYLLPVLYLYLRPMAVAPPATQPQTPAPQA
ncbi:MAG: iron uptake transporter permease EfeU [Chloroflexota bacterium]